MRYVAPIALPVGLGEWLGAELEARGIESASLYARAVISILLQSDQEPEVESETADPSESWSRRAAMELEMKLERQKERESKRGRLRHKQQAVRNKGHTHKAPPSSKKDQSASGGGTLRRRPHSWNGDGDQLKKTAAVECLLTATDEKWPVEKLVDELYARVKLIQLEGPGSKWGGAMGSSAPVNCRLRTGKQESQDSVTSVDSDSFTSVSSPEVSPENYFSAFPPLDTSSPVQSHPEEEQPATVWAVPLKYGRTNQDQARVPFLRVIGSRLSPRESPAPPLDNEITNRNRSARRGDPGRNSWSRPGEGNEDIWAPCEEDWSLLGDNVFSSDVAQEKLEAIQQSLALLNHNPNMSSFIQVMPSIGRLGSSRLHQWMGALKRSVQELLPAEEDEGNLPDCAQSHFCPIQSQAEPEVNVKDGATFAGSMRSPSGALYLPEAEETGTSEWTGGEWNKYMVYSSPIPPPEEKEEVTTLQNPSGSPFSLKFRALQTEKYCQTKILPAEEEAAEFQACSVMLNSDSVWKFDAEVLKDVIKPEAKLAEEDPAEGSITPDEEEEEDEGLLKEIFSFGAEAKPEEEVHPAEVAEAEEADLDELWNPLDNDGYDVCEWVSQDVYDREDFDPSAEGNLAEWSETCAESWPPPYIPVEYLDDEFFDEIFGSMESKSIPADAKPGEKKSSRRRRRTNSQQHHQQQHRKRPCSFFVEGECLKADCKFSHDLGTIPCRFWLESSCFKGDACPFMHAKPAKTRGRRRSYSQSDADSAAENAHHPRAPRHNTGKKPNFELDLENDFPSLSQAVECPGKFNKSRPIPINNPGTNGGEGGGASVKRRRRKATGSRPTAPSASSDSSPNVKKSVPKNPKKSNPTPRKRSVSEQGAVERLSSKCGTF